MTERVKAGGEGKIPESWWGLGLDSWNLGGNGAGRSGACVPEEGEGWILGSGESKDSGDGFLDFQRK